MQLIKLLSKERFMKKAKILAVFGILLAMGLTACNKESNSGGDEQSQETPATESGEHVHSYGDWVVVKEPTCTEKGSQEQKCSCGDTKTKAINALGHDWGEWTVKTAATCTTDGVERRVCKRCDEPEERAIKAAHDWDTEQTIPAGTDPADQVSYKLAVCKKGDAIKADIKAVDAKFYKGKIKESSSNPTPEGYFKLDNTGSKAYWKFTVAGNKLYKGMLYQLGAMDSFSSNTDRTYAMTSTSGDHAPSYPLGNFDVKVNGDSLDKSQWIDIPFSTLLADGEDSSAMGSNFSPLAMAPIGECVIQPGLNEVTYERLGSYNLIISDLIFIGSEYEHVHAPASTWSSNDEQHWHACTAPGCPTGKLDVANHTFGDWVENKAATCKEAGERQHTCSACGKVVKEEIAKLAHTLGDPHDIVAATCASAGSQKRTCSACSEVITEVLPKLDHNFGDAVDSFAAGEGYIATTAHNCSVCNKGGLRWNARNYDKTLSSSDLDLEHDEDKSVRFASGAVENKNGAAATGSHIIYNIKVDGAVDKAGLSFKIKNTAGASGIAPIFGMVAGDGSVGAVKNADGTFTTTTKRYGLRVNDVEYFLGNDSYGNKSSVTGWFEWPVEFPLKDGINKIDVFAYAGYRADLYEFQLNGLSKFESSHTHNGDDVWLNDTTDHWHKCTAEGCAIADGIYDKAEHTFGDPYDVVAATCSAKGSYKVKCSVCNYVKTVETDKVAHTWGPAQAAVGDAIPHECTTCHAMCYELTLAEPAKVKADVEWNVTGMPAGKYEVYAYACTGSLTQNMQSRYQFGFDGTYVALEARTAYSAFGFGVGEDLASCQWTKAIMTVTAGENAAKFAIHWVGNGYSAFYGAIRLVKVA